MPFRKLIMSRARQALDGVDDAFLVKFFEENPVIAERCRVAIIVAQEDEQRNESQTELPFPHAEPL